MPRGAPTKPELSQTKSIYRGMQIKSTKFHTNFIKWVLCVYVSVLIGLGSRCVLTSSHTCLMCTNTCWSYVSTSAFTLSTSALSLVVALCPAECLLSPKQRSYQHIPVSYKLHAIPIDLSLLFMHIWRMFVDCYNLLIISLTLYIYCIKSLIICEQTVFTEWTVKWTICAKHRRLVWGNHFLLRCLYTKLLYLQTQDWQLYKILGLLRNFPTLLFLLFFDYFNTLICSIIDAIHIR